jgi:hypothetical protein
LKPPPDSALFETSVTETVTSLEKAPPGTVSDGPLVEPVLTTAPQESDPVTEVTPLVAEHADEVSDEDEDDVGELGEVGDVGSDTAAVGTTAFDMCEERLSSSVVAVTLNA